MALVLVTGGTGQLGREVVPRLVSGGHDVRLLSRQDRPSRPDGVEAVRGDVLTGDGLDRAVAGVDVVVHCATSPFRRTTRPEADGPPRLTWPARGCAPAAGRTGLSGSRSRVAPPVPSRKASTSAPTTRTETSRGRDGSPNIGERRGRLRREPGLHGLREHDVAAELQLAAHERLHAVELSGDEPQEVGQLEAQGEAW